MRSISCIQTADEHSTVTVPSRSETGCAACAIAGAGGLLPDALDVGQQRRRAPGAG